MLGPQDLMIGLVLAVFFFGAKRLPELASSVGKSMKEFKKAVESNGADDAEAAKAEAAHPEAPPASSAKRVCAACQAALEADWRHCPRCGADAAAVSSSAVPPAS